MKSVPIWIAAIPIVSGVFWIAVRETDGQTKKQVEPRIVAAGTATWTLGKAQTNNTSVRVRLSDDIAAKLGDDYIVLLTSRLSGYPYFSPYWKKANDGFDIVLIDPSLAPNGSTDYLIPVNRTYLVDWIVVKK